MGSSRVEVYKRMGSSRAEVYKRVGFHELRHIKGGDFTS